MLEPTKDAVKAYTIALGSTVFMLGSIVAIDASSIEPSGLEAVIIFVSLVAIWFIGMEVATYYRWRHLD